MERRVPHGTRLAALLLAALGGCAGPSAKVDENAAKAELAAAGWTTSYAEAQARSKAEGKPILADFTGSDWCTWCKKLHEGVFSTREFHDWAAKNVVLLELDFPQRTRQDVATRKQNASLQEKLQPAVFPTVVFLTADGAEIGRCGYADGPVAWIAKAEEALHSKK
jgi:thiol:disulfide interchange protein